MATFRCECGCSEIVSKEKDEDYGQYYIIVECQNCGFYWEGYYGYFE